MKGLILYFSLTGNTKLSMEYLSKKITDVEFDLYDIKNDKMPNMEKYDFYGFATFADHMGPPKYMRDFVDNMPNLSGKYAFVVNTFGGMSGPTLNKMKDMAEVTGLNVISGHSLHMPQNYPPMLKRKMTSENAPSDKELSKFNSFINDLSEQLSKIQNNESFKSKKVKGEVLSMNITLPDDYTKKEMGLQVVNEDKCIECGKCESVCPYDAIERNGKPTFDHDKCLGCWACYNHCPKKAIETEAFKGELFYSKPSNLLKEKFEVINA